MMIETSERGKRQVVAVSFKGCVEDNSIPKIRVVHSGDGIDPEYIGKGVIVMRLKSVKESRSLCLHALQIVHYVMGPTAEGALSGATHQRQQVLTSSLRPNAPKKNKTKLF